MDSARQSALKVVGTLGGFGGQNQWLRVVGPEGGLDREAWILPAKVPSKWSVL